MSENRMDPGDRHAACLDMTLGGAGGLGMVWGIDHPDTSNISSHGGQAVPKGPPDPLGGNFFSRKAMYTYIYTHIYWCIALGSSPAECVSSNHLSLYIYVCLNTFGKLCCAVAFKAPLIGQGRVPCL